MPWDRSDIVAAAFAAAGPHAAFDTLRVQKLLFLTDREVSERIGGPYFDFRPHRYGPFDPALYLVLDDLARAKDVRFADSGPCRRYLLSDKGRGVARLCWIVSQNALGRTSEMRPDGSD